ncbi:MAG: GNAT family N-acetyltransferase [Gaiellaceae bacterium]
MPRRLTRTRLADDRIRLEPLTQAHRGHMIELARDPEVLRYTRVPADADEAYVTGWIGRYEEGWEDGRRLGWTIRDAAGGAFLGFAAIVTLDLGALEGEIGYMVAPEARGRGVATRAVALLTRWGFDELGLERLELRIDPANLGSVRVAERSGYRLDGVLRHMHLKDGLRADTGVWSRLRQD